MNSDLTVRKSCLVPFSDDWQQPTPTEIRTVMKEAGFTGSQLAKACGLKSARSSGGRTVRRWLSGDSEIPYAVWCLLCYEAGYGIIWRLHHRIAR